jgi:hypothetical protein
VIAPEDRGLGRVKFHPETNRAFAIEPRTVVGVTYKYWAPGPLPRLDQGQEGECVAFADANELAASPKRLTGITNAYARTLFQEIRAIDRSMGNFWDEGASTLAGMKALQARGKIREYRWAFSMEAIKTALLTEGPVVIGIDWLDGMYETLPNGRVEVSGSVVGGHEILIDGWSKSRKLPGDDKYYEYYRWLNSWGGGYGINGHGFVRAADMADLIITRRGEAVIPMGRAL